MDIDVTDEIADFHDVAQRFCAWCDAPVPAGSDATASSREVQILLARLIAAAFQLPEGSADTPEVERSAATALMQIVPKLSVLPVGSYNMFVQPYKVEDEPVLGHLTDDLKDIYSELKEGLALHALGYPAAAAWHWRFSYATHWGRHAASAPQALQAEAADNR